MGGCRKTRELRHLLLLTAVGLVLLLAGCLGGSGPEEPLDETDVDEAENASMEAQLTQVDGLGFEGPTAVATVSENGSFGAADGAFFGGSVRGADTREHDLTPQVPTRAPVTVNVTINYTGEASQLNGELLLEDVEVYDQHYVKDVDTDTIWMEASLARTDNAGSIVAIVQADSAGEAPQRPYSLEATIRSHGETMLPGVPTEVPVSEQTGGFAVDTQRNGTDVPELLLWGPEGSILRTEAGPGPIAFPAQGDQAMGRHVVMAMPDENATGVDDQPLSVGPMNASQAAGEELAVVPIETRVGTWQAVEAGSEANWSFELDRAPVQAGMRVRPTGMVGTTGIGALEVRLASPAGGLVEESIVGTYGGQSEITWLSGVGETNVVPGSYDAAASLGDSGTSWEAAHVVRELQLR